MQMAQHQVQPHPIRALFGVPPPPMSARGKIPKSYVKPGADVKLMEPYQQLVKQHDKEDSELRKCKHRPLVSPHDASQLRWLNECIGGPSGSSTKVLHTLQTRRTEGLHA